MINEDGERLLRVINEEEYLQINDQLEEIRLKQECLYQSYMTTKSLLNRLTILKSHVRSACKDVDNSEINGMRKGLLSTCKVREGAKPVITFSMMEQSLGDLTLRYPNEDMFNPNSFIWRTLADMYRTHHYKCFNLWINRNSQDAVFTKEDDELILDGANSRRDWIDFGRRANKPPFLLFRRYKKLTSSKEKTRWAPDEDLRLRQATELYGEGKWTRIANYVGTRNPKQCLHRYRNQFFPNIKKGRWTAEEDEALKTAIFELGLNKWNKISEYVKTRNDAQCRERWVNILNPIIRRTPWDSEERRLLHSLVDKYGTKNWALISSAIGNRTDSQCRREYFKSISNKKYKK
jgi:hypothetical protein